MHGYSENKADYLKRLRRIEGQVRGLQRMVDEDVYCIDILTQVSAVTKALQSVALGLLDELARGTTLQDAQAMVLDYVRAWVPEAGRAPLGGNTVATDRAFLVRDMPELEAYLHYRIVDVSSVKELARRWYPRAYFAAPRKTGGHRALGDIRDSIAELRHYREAVFVKHPGPDSTTLKQIAARHTRTPQA